MSINLRATPAESEPRIPVAILGGYLGAGKTTVINRMLGTTTGRRIAVLVNDFGAVNIDADLIARHDGQTISLTNGCVCCSIAGDLGTALVSVAAMRPRPHHIVIEASGVADPGRVANYAHGHAGLGLDAIIVLADAETIRRRCRDRFVGETVRRQLAAADLLAITKTDLVSPARLADVRDWLAQTYSGTTIVGPETDAAALLIGGFEHDPRTRSVDDTVASHDPAAHGGDHVAITIDFPQPIDRRRAEAALASIGGDILRCKGWVRFVDAPECPVLVQGVGRRIEFADHNPPSRYDRLCLVVICRNDGASRRRAFDKLHALLPAATRPTTPLPETMQGPTP